MISELNHLQFLLDDDTRAQLLDAMRDFQQRHGKEWLSHFKANYPVFCEIIDLCANYEVEPALDEFLKHVKKIIKSADVSPMIKAFALGAAEPLLQSHENTLRSIHAEIRAEIDRKQF